MASAQEKFTKVSLVRLFDRVTPPSIKIGKIKQMSIELQIIFVL
jgi:hypothetical protein